MANLSTIQWAKTPPSASWRFDGGSGRPPRRDRSPRRRSASPRRGDKSPQKDDRRDRDYDRDYDRRDRDRSRSPDRGRDKDHDDDMKDVRDTHEGEGRDTEPAPNGDSQKGLWSHELAFRSPQLK